ncbi:MAG: S8 family serine peptidase, partial [Blastocatellia bacterium]|nr:S8 family serine peptidase [Blastocatellia bacterium]
MRLSLRSTTRAVKTLSALLLYAIVFSNVLVTGATAAVVTLVDQESNFTDLTRRAHEGRISDRPELDASVQRLIAVLSSVEARQPVLVSDSGQELGLIVEQTALRQASAKAESRVVRVEVNNLFSSSTGALEAAASFAEILEEDASATIFVDQIPTIFELPGVAEIIEAFIHNGGKIIGGSSPAAYASAVSQNKNFERLFQALEFANSTETATDEKHGFRGDNVSSDIRAAIASGRSGRLEAILQTSNHSDPAFRSLLNQLDIRVTETIGTNGLLVVNAPLSSIEQLSVSGRISYISPNRATNATGHVEVTTGATLARAGAMTGGSGAGIGIAIVDSGIDLAHNGFRKADGSSRITASVDFTSNGTADRYGHGTHVAGLAAGSLDKNNGAYRGVAPEANLVSVKVLDDEGFGQTAWLLNGLDWILQNREQQNIRIVNLSLGTTAIDTWTNDPLCRKVRELTEAGIVVFAAAGNLGRGENGEKVYGAIHSPGNSPHAITIGATNSFGTDNRGDDVVTTYTSRGPTRSSY